MITKQTVLGYARVSSAEQVSGTSLGDQVAKIKKHAEFAELELEEIFVDEGISGRKDSRPQYDAMMQRCREGGVHGIIVTKLDRFGRSVRHLSDAFHELDKLGVQFISIADNIDTSTTTGKLVRNILAVIAEFESDMIRDRMLGGRVSLAGAGIWPQGRAPYGYKLVEDGPRGNNVEIDEHEAKQIKIAYDQIVNQKKSCGAAARHLNALGYTQPLGAKWDRTVLRERLSKDYWSGTFVWHLAPGDFEIDIPPILTQAEMESLHTALKQSGRTIVPNRGTFPLSGHLFGTCELHGEVAWTGRTKPAGRYYRCKGQQERIEEKDQGCKCQYIKADIVEDAVWDEIMKLLASPERLIDHAQRHMETRSQQMGIETNQVAEIDKRIKAIQKQLNSGVVDMMKHGYDMETINGVMDELRIELESHKELRLSIQTWNDENAEHSDNMRRVWEIAEQLHSDLNSKEETPLSTKAELFDALDLRVEMVDFHQCNRCAGSGRFYEKGRRGGHSCPQCGGRGNVPELEITGRITDLMEESDSSAVPLGSLRYSYRQCTGNMLAAFALNALINIGATTIECGNGHPQIPENVYSFAGNDYCKICRRDAARRYRAKKLSA